MDDERLLRYGRQIMLPQIDIEGQEKLAQSTALIIGLGGLGSPIAMYLATAGVGHLILVDFDEVELSNLQRQIIHHNKDLGRPKVESAKDTLLSLNPETRITCINEKLDEAELTEQVRQADVVLDGSDNFTTRFMVNRVCVKQKTPLVSGAAIRMEGQIAVFMNNLPDSPCYQCLYKEEGEEETRCSETGVLAPVVGIIGSLQATEAIKILSDITDESTGWILIMDALRQEWRKLKLAKDPNCPICG
ncbi:MAG: molybdopterin-synthase adenylyltransferase MoeB [Gammaproteobacteria bacterium]|nr:molybdopterin-synthase adenylyltransferase MoeB [Gammaproteobacteria bacterium]